VRPVSGALAAGAVALVDDQPCGRSVRFV